VEEEGPVSGFGGRIDVAVDLDEPEVTLGTAPLGLLTEVEGRTRGAVEGSLGVTLGAVVVEFLSHVRMSRRVAFEDTGFR
jgi:hypothetical protein